MFCHASVAFAYPMPQMINVEKVLKADAVVIGTVSNYQGIRDFERERRQVELMKDFAALGPEFLPRHKDVRIMSSASFDVVTEQILWGAAARQLHVTWETGVSGVAETLEPGQYLLVLNRRASTASPAEAASTAAGSAAVMTLFPSDCSSSYIMKPRTVQAKTLRRELRLAKDRLPVNAGDGGG
ncbi:hypothetical protein IP76_17780 [Rhizobium sp. AAP43]|nr:hypothetical protein IP76_17780 [Rhizobium sp. AAP43]